MSVVLIIDDMPALREEYAYDVRRLGGHEVLTAAGGAEGLQVLENENIDCVVLDLEMPGVDGFEVLTTLKRRRSRVPVIVYTGTGDYERCVRAVKLGAYSFLAKDEPLERVAREVDNAVTWGALTREVASLRRRTGQDSPLVGDSRPMAELKEMITRLASIPSAVLVQGESGCGKELVARQLHRAGPRAKGPFVAVNCAALPEALFESELFGHERGAFTGADRTRRGAFESAGGGTLFLDEIGELPAQAQAKLLRVLEENEVTRVGSSRPIQVDTRVVAATNRDLAAEAESGRFRSDLLYRLNVHLLIVPPLRRRRADVPALVVHFLDLTCAAFGVAPKRAAPETLELMSRGSWRRNNVRELRNAVERLVLACDEPVIGPQHVPADLVDETARTAGGRAGGTAGGATPGWTGGSLKDLKTGAERRILLEALEAHEWHITATARSLGLADHSSLLKIMRRHGLKRPD